LFKLPKGGGINRKDEINGGGINELLEVKLTKNIYNIIIRFDNRRWVDDEILFHLLTRFTKRSSLADTYPEIQCPLVQPPATRAPNNIKIPPKKDSPLLNYKIIKTNIKNKKKNNNINNNNSNIIYTELYEL
jgi:hypothetical protein